MSTAAQPSLAFPAKLTEPFHPAIARLDSGQALPGLKLTQSAKRLYARFSRQQMAAQSKGRQAFRAKLATLAEDLELNERTIRRAIDQLKDIGLLQVVRTGRSSWFRLLPLPQEGSRPLRSVKYRPYRPYRLSPCADRPDLLHEV